MLDLPSIGIDDSDQKKYSTVKNRPLVLPRGRVPNMHMQSPGSDLEHSKLNNKIKNFQRKCVCLPT